MKYAYQKNMTKEMIECLHDGDELYAEALRSWEKMKLAKKAGSIGLPATSASGLPVVHGTRMQMRNIADYWQQRFELAKNSLDRQFEAKLHKELDRREENDS